MMDGNRYIIPLNIVSIPRKRLFSIAALEIGPSNIADVPRDGTLVRIMSIDGAPSFPMYYNSITSTFMTLCGHAQWHIDMPDSGATHWRTERVN